MCNKTVQKIDVLIRAKSPVIAIQSAEEVRVIGELQLLAQKQNKRLIVWSAALGFRQLVPDKQPAAKAPDPLAALTRIITEAEAPNSVPTIWVMNDLHQFAKNPVIMRAVRDTAHTVKEAKGITVILLGANVEISEDARKDIVFVDFPLPSAEELAEQVDAFIAGLPEHVEVKLNGNRQALIRALQGLTKDEADSVLSQAAISHRCLDERALAFVLETKAQIIKASGALEYFAAKASYAEIGGLDLLKVWAREAEKAATPEAQAFGVEAPRGCLLVGVPGCGKSLVAKAIAGSDRPLLRLDAGALRGSLVGQSEAQTRQMIKVVEAVGRSVLWIDEIEKGFGSSGGELNGGVDDHILGTLLTAMQEGLKETTIVATANDIAGIRPELIRRFPVKFFVDLPVASEREEILKIHLGKRGRDPQKFDLDAVVKATENFTGSEIEEVVQAAIMRAFSRGKADVETEDLLAVIADTVPLSTTMKEQIAGMREWATRARPASSAQESGHKAQAPGSVSGLLEF